MKVDLIKFGATIPTGQYANLQPSIEMSDVSIADAEKFGMDFIKGLYSKYSENELVEKEIIYSKYTKKSFNEEGVEIEFEPIAHTYHYNGKLLTSATDYIKRFFKPFDSVTISEVSGKAWGVEPSQVAGLWDANGKLTSLFGTVVHNALELYNNYCAMGEKIQKHKNSKLKESDEQEGNYAMPKHPILKSIIEGLIKIDNTKGKIYSEVLLTDVEGGNCGHADRVVVTDEKKKICRIGDFKVNINSEEIDKNSKVLAPFDELPANKLSKYQLQMSIYANMLQKSGWTVEALDIYVYEDGWKYFELPVLKVL